MSHAPKQAHAAGTVEVGDLTVHRLGYGAMQITGPGVWGDPPDRAEAIAVLRHAVELGVDFIDTADSYGPFVSEELIREALHPYRGVTIATKAGLLRTGPSEWHPLARPEYLRQQTEMALRRLGLEQIPLMQLHRVDPTVPMEDSVGELAALQKEGKIRHIGLSEVSVDQIESARTICEIASVQNLYNLANRTADEVVNHCTAHDIAFIPWFPVATGELARPGGILDHAAERFGATPAQLALAWLLRRSPVMLPIPGTKSLEHLAENIAAAEVQLSEEQYEELLDAA
jgi:pyridoxine 4-dehydrogenase